MEPLSVAVHAVATLAQLKTSQAIVVWGSGPVGLLCMAVAKALSASRIIAVDINQTRLDFAKSYAATYRATCFERWREQGRILEEICRGVEADFGN